MAETDDKQQNIDQSHGGSGNNVAGDSFVGDKVAGNKNVYQKAPKSPGRTGVEPPNNLGDRGIRDLNQFVGREEAIADLHEKLQGAQRVAIAGVAGMGGVGKTELAVQYGRRFLRTEYGGGVVWLSGAQGFTDLLSFAQGVLFPDQKLAEIGDEAAIVQFIWNRWPASTSPPEPVLVIFDDVTDYGAQVVPVLPTNNDSRFRVVVTTRQRLEGIERLDLDVLLPGDAIALLGAIAGKDRVVAERETAAAICEWLGFLPLAVELVGYFLKKKARLSLAEMLSRLQGKRAESKALNPRRLPEGLTARRGVLDAFELSWQELGAEAQELAMRLSLFAPATIPWALMEGCWQEADGEDLEEWRDEELVRLHLLNEREDGYGLHPLVREFLAMRLEEQEEAGEWRSAFAEALKTVAEKSLDSRMTKKQVTEVNILIPHLKGVTDFDAAQFPEACAAICTQLTEFYYAQGLFMLAEEWGERSLEIREEQLGATHPSTATSLNNLALLYQSQGRYEEAEKLRLRCLKIEEASLPNDHPQIASSLNNLAGLYGDQGRYSEAEPLYRRSLEIFEKQLGANHPSTATSLNNLAGLYQDQGRYSEAEPLYRRSLEIKEEQLGATHPSTATSLNNLASLYKSQGRYSEAEPLYRRSLEIDEEQLGANHPSTAIDLNNLAGLYESQGRYSEAEPLYRRSLEIREEQLGVTHPSTAISLNNLADLLEKLEKYGEAEPMYCRSIEIFQTALGNDHPNTQQGTKNFQRLIKTVIEKNQTAQLSDHPLTQAILQQLQQQNPDPS
ncbi:MAG: tetratricopeptide repeat protein [Cyanobacteria bacterium P01_C01_bin.89]